MGGEATAVQAVLATQNVQEQLGYMRQTRRGVGEKGEEKEKIGVWKSGNVPATSNSEEKDIKCQVGGQPGLHSEF